MTAPHLDDEQLSLLLDGLEPEGRGHVHDEGCADCLARLEQLQAARDAVAAATVAPLTDDVLDRLVSTALAAPPDVAEVVPLTRRRRLAAPPPAWLLGAAAAIAVLAGVAGLVQSSRSDDGGSMASTVRNLETADAESSSPAAGGVAADAAVQAPMAAGDAFADPEVVSADLADQDDPDQLALALDGLTKTLSGTPTASAYSARAAAGGSAGAAEEGDETSAAASPPAPTTTAAADRAQCRGTADAIGGGRFSALLSTATLRWKGQPAEVLVYRLAEPSAPDEGGVTRQALVLSRPGCSLLADPRF